MLYKLGCGGGVMVGAKKTTVKRVDFYQYMLFSRGGEKMEIDIRKKDK